MREKLIELLREVQYLGGLEEKIADHLIANGVTIQKWIPVSERLPQEKGEICKNVILLMDDGVVTTGWLNEDIGSGYYLPPYDDFISKVPLSRFTHWMYLPEPPKEGE